MQKFKIILISLALSLIFLAGWRVLWYMQTVDEELEAIRWHQKDLTLYGGEGPFMVRPHIAAVTFHLFMLQFRPHYEIFVTRKDNPDYGHIASIDFENAYLEGIKGIKKTKMEFSEKGLTITQPRERLCSFLRNTIAVDDNQRSFSKSVYPARCTTLLFAF